MVLSPARPGIKNDCAGEDQHILIPPTDSRYRELLSIIQHTVCQKAPDKMEQNWDAWIVYLVDTNRKEREIWLDLVRSGRSKGKRFPPEALLSFNAWITYVVRTSRIVASLEAGGNTSRACD
jgi:hypothetical protein